MTHSDLRYTKGTPVVASVRIITPNEIPTELFGETNGASAFATSVFFF